MRDLIGHHYYKLGPQIVRATIGAPVERLRAACKANLAEPVGRLRATSRQSSKLQATRSLGFKPALAPSNRTGIARHTKEKPCFPTLVQVKGTIVPDGASRLQRLSSGAGRTCTDQRGRPLTFPLSGGLASFSRGP